MASMFFPEVGIRLLRGIFFEKICNFLKKTLDNYTDSVYNTDTR